MSLKEEFSSIDMATAAAEGFRDGQRAAQSAPAGEREALQRLLDDVRDVRNAGDVAFGWDEAAEYFGASWQRTQSAGVPEGWRPVPVASLERMLRFIDPAPVRMPNGDTMTFQNPHAAAALREISAEFRAMLSAAPAQGQQVEWRTTAVMLEQANAGLAQLNGKLRAELSALKAQQVGQEPQRCQCCGYLVTESEHRGCLRAAAPQPAPAQDVAGWIPVTERLPNCGQAVLAYYLNRQGMGRRIRAEYVTRWTVEAEMFADPDTECVEYSEQEDTYYVTEGWYELIDNWDEYARIAVNEGVVTSWMPLPAAPTHDKQSGGNHA